MNGTGVSRTLLRRVLPWGFAACAAALAAWLLLAAPGGGASRAPEAKEVRAVPLTRGSLEVTAAATGTFQPLEYVDVGAQLSGQLKSVAVKPGDEVRRGQIIAAIDDATARARLAQTEAALAGVHAQIAAKRSQAELARAQRDRNLRLVERGFLSVATMDAAEAGLASLEAETDSLRAQAASLTAVIEQARTELRHAEVRAPIDGVVVSLAARPGQTLNAAQQAPVILRIADLRSLALYAQVSEADVVHVRPGMQVRFHLLGIPDRPFAGRVREILPAPNIINSVVFYDVVVELPQPPDALFRIGMTAQAYFVIARHECMIRIPRAALPPDLRPPQTVRLTVLEAGGAQRAASVEVAAADDGEGGVPCEAAARAGLGDGTRVVMPPAAKKGKAK